MSAGYSIQTEIRESNVIKSTITTALTAIKTTVNLPVQYVVQTSYHLKLVKGAQFQLGIGSIIIFDILVKVGSLNSFHSVQRLPISQ